MYASVPPQGASTAAVTKREAPAPPSYCCSMTAMPFAPPPSAVAIAPPLPGTASSHSADRLECGPLGARSARSASQAVDDPRGRHRGELALHGVRQHHQVADRARAIPDVVGEQRLRL